MREGSAFCAGAAAEVPEFWEPYIQFGVTIDNEKNEACDKGRAWTSAILRRLNSMLNCGRILK